MRGSPGAPGTLEQACRVGATLAWLEMGVDALCAYTFGSSFAAGLKFVAAQFSTDEESKHAF